MKQKEKKNDKKHVKENIIKMIKNIIETSVDSYFGIDVETENAEEFVEEMWQKMNLRYYETWWCN